MKNNTEALSDVSKEAYIKVNTEETQYILSHYQNSWHNHDLKRANISFEIVAQLIYLGTTVTSENLVHDDITRRLNPVFACYHSFQNSRSYLLLSKSVKIKINQALFCLWMTVKRNNSRSWTEGVWERGVEKHIWTVERCDRRFNETAWRGTW
jgi:hypothetical protein